MKKIMIVEDDRTMCQELKILLETAGYEAEILTDFERSEKRIFDSQADLILLDINIPGLNGEMLLKRIRKKAEIPIIMVTSRTSEVDEVLSMSYGADDYITKPYNPTILLLRIAAVLKRTDQGGREGVERYRDLSVNSARGVLSGEEIEIQLTKNEMIIFQTLLQKQGQIVSRDELMTNLWDNHEFINDNALTVNISRLRGKLAEAGFPDAIETRKKQGYLLL
ncbi:MAG: response regulator transcription factor [Lachnospiraceae bacterium]|nr:response regulator transcription factor [Lachnospiraceae bacterium]